MSLGSSRASGSGEHVETGGKNLMGPTSSWLFYAKPALQSLKSMEETRCLLSFVRLISVGIN